MAYNSVTSEKFAEDLYFLLMASPVRARIETLGARYGFTPAALRNEILALATIVGRNAAASMHKAAVLPRQNTG